MVEKGNVKGKTLIMYIIDFDNYLHVKANVKTFVKQTFVKKC